MADKGLVLVKDSDFEDPVPVREEIAEAKRRLYSRPESQRNAMVLLRYIKHLEANQREWISVEERLPERVGVDTQFVTISTFPGEELHIQYFNSRRWKKTEVTHWMEIPPSPKEGE